MKTKHIIFLLALLFILGGSARSDFAQVIADQHPYREECDTNNWSPIRCGYFGEGYQDGANDARNNLENDYKRYKRKFDKEFEDYYREGYDRGYATVRPFARWSDKQKDVYEQGYDDGDDDKDRGISRLPARYEGQYDQEYEAYYRRGYFDGFDQRDKRYDLPLGPRGRIIRNTTGIGETVPSRTVIGRPGRASGTLNWSGRVDRRVNIIVQGNSYRLQTLTGRGFGRGVGTMSGALPRRQSRVSVRKRDGRGSANVIQQPSRVNSYTAIIQVDDPRRGSDNYRLDISWQSSNALERYSSGKLRWRGRVDQTVNIRISGTKVENVVLYGNPLRNVTQSMTGYLARRQGTVRVRKLDGRGTVTVLEQPSRQNNYFAVIRVFDPKGGSDEYDIEVSW